MDIFQHMDIVIRVDFIILYFSEKYNEYSYQELVIFSFYYTIRVKVMGWYNRYHE